ncbi:MAG TPA: family 43 glycosylhydrolase, partial [Polyangiaceae bacterium]|nr:family 43 glycosylhydrolase [Polyangiaceae bacterium]
MMYRTKLLAAMALACATAAPACEGFWTLSGDVNVHDPSITHEGSNWYVFSTGPGLQVLKSTDGGARWFRAPQIFSSALPWWQSYVPNNTNNDIWAPDVETYNGRVWLYYSISTFGSRTSAIGLASAPSIEAGGWRDEGLVIRTTDANDYNAIDPNLVIDTSGSPWLAFGSFWSGLKLTALDRSTMKP